MKITKYTKQNIFKSVECSVELAELRGYKWIKNLFCDSSGFGASDEPSLTQTQLMIELDRILAEHGTVYAFVTGVGMFQVNIGIYIKSGKPIAKRLSNNSYKIPFHGGYKIRLYNTDILEFHDSGDIIVDNGGYATMTTHRHMNKYLPNGYHAYSKDFETIIQHDEKKIIIDGATKIN